MSGNLLILFLVFFPFAAGLVNYLLGRHNKTGRDRVAILITAIELAATIVLVAMSLETPTDLYWEGFAGFGLHFRADGFRLVMAMIAAITWFFTTVQSIEYFNKLNGRNRNRYYMFMLWTLGATMAIFLSANLYTTFIFFEVMTFTSYVLVIHGESEKAIDASKSYLGFGVLGGLVTLMGLFMLQANIGTLEMDQILSAIQSSGTSYGMVLASGLLILFGFGVKAGMYPLHTWLPKAYVAAPEPATALLSAVLSKAGIFGIFVVTGQILLHDYTWGLVILIAGTLTMLTGAMLAVFSTNFKRTIACSSMSQIGFILVGTGMQAVLGEHNAIAVQGSVLHLVNHSFIKLALFMVAGIIFMNLKDFDLNKIKGWGRNKWLIKLVSASAILGVAGVPFFNGYISKTLIHESLVEYIAMFPETTGMAVLFKIIEALFIFTGGLTFCYMLKIFVAVFIEKNNDPELQAEYSKKSKYVSIPVKILLGILGVLFPVIGILPHYTQDVIGDMSQHFLNGHGMEHQVAYFSWANISGALASLSIGALFYFLIVRPCLMKKREDGKKDYIDAWNYKLDMEKYFYRPTLFTVLPFIGAFAARLVFIVGDGVAWLYKSLFFIKRPERFNSKEEDEFALYEKPQKAERVPRGISYSLLLFVIGVVAVLYFVLLVAFN